MDVYTDAKFRPDTSLNMEWQASEVEFGFAACVQRRRATVNMSAQGQSHPALRESIRAVLVNLVGASRLFADPSRTSTNMDGKITSRAYDIVVVVDRGSVSRGPYCRDVRDRPKASDGPVESGA
ncbi:hypothetical protein Landi51_10193 [Colletotrichum acutatum]